MRILIVDDEQPARARLRRLLGQSGLAGLQIDEARDGIEALAMAQRQPPDLIFLDIEMPEVSGLEVAASLPAPAPPVVFVTAYDQYAVRAFDANAIDYLQKPFDLARLQRALARVAARHAVASAAGPTQQQLQQLQQLQQKQQQQQQPAAPSAPALPLQQLLVSERGVTRVLPIDAIGWIETADNYVVLHCADRHPLLRQSLAALLDRLGPRFVRCHRRAAVQLAWIDQLVHGDKGDGEVLLRGGARVPCSRQYRAALLARLAQGDARC